MTRNRNSSPAAPRTITSLRKAGRLASVATICWMATSALTGQVQAANPCYMQIRASGTYIGKVSERSGVFGQSFINVDFEVNSVGNPRIAVMRNIGNCNRDPNYLPSSRDNVVGQYDDALMYLILNDLAAGSFVEGASSAQGPGDPRYAAMQEFNQWTRSIRTDVLVRGVTVVAVNAVYELVTRLLLSELSFPRALLLTFSKEVVQAFLQGKDGTAFNDFFRDAILDIIIKLPDSGDDSAEKAAKLARLFASVVEAELKDVFKPQTLTAIASEEDCDYQLTATLDPHARNFLVLFDKLCNGSLTDPSSVALTATGEVEPGDDVTGSVSATNVLGVPVGITNVTGIKDGLPDKEKASFAWTAQPTNGAPWQFKFTVPDPRRHEEWNLKGTVTTVTGRMDTPSVAYKVKDMAPEIKSVEGGEVAADPDNEMALVLTVTVKDKNADDENKGEVPIDKMKIGGHPGGLDTTLKFDDFTDRSGGDPDANGVYTFTLGRTATVKGPHEEGDFLTQLVAFDDNGNASDPEDITLTVNNVAPVIKLAYAMPSSVWATPVREIDFKVKIVDRNGADDIASVEVDATAAGGDVYTMASGLKETERDKESITFQLASKFLHKAIPGTYPIPTNATDKDDPPHKVSQTPNLEVRASAPDITGIGMIWGEDPMPVPPPDNLCPGDVFTFGVIIEHPQGLAMTVNAGIGTPGNPPAGPGTAMAHTSRHIYTVTMSAPADPGVYMIQVIATGPDGKVSKQELFFTVKKCRPTTGDGIALGGAMLDAVVNAGAGLATVGGGYVITPLGQNDGLALVAQAQQDVADRQIDIVIAIQDHERDRQLAELRRQEELIREAELASNLTDSGNVFANDFNQEFAVDDQFLNQFQEQQSEGFADISELFAGVSQGFPAASDPCSTGCGLTDDDLERLRNAFVTGEFGTGTEFGSDVSPAFSGTEVSIGGNPDLQEETSDSFTVGFVAQPNFTPGLNITLDYYNIDIGAITSNGDFSPVPSRPITSGSDSAIPETAVSQPFTGNIEVSPPAVRIAPSDGFDSAIGRFSADGGCGFSDFELFGNELSLSARIGSQTVRLEVSGTTATGANVVLYGQGRHNITIRYVSGGLDFSATHAPSGGSCRSTLQPLF